MSGGWGATAPRSRSCALLVFIIFAAAGVLPSSSKASGKKCDWIEVRSPHFTVDSNSGKGQAKMVALQFEMIRDAIVHVFPRAENLTTAPLTVLAVDGETSLKRLLPRYFKKGRAHPGGIFASSFFGNYIVLRADTIDPGVYNPVFHEYTHFVMRKTLPGTPVWLVEGMADYYSDTRVEKNEVVIGYPDVENLRVLRSGASIPLRTLLTADYSSPYFTKQQKMWVFYAESWALTHYLMLQDAMHHTHRVGDYAQQVEEGGDPVGTFVKIFGPLKSSNEKFSTYVGNLAFFGLKYPIAVKLSSKTYIVRRLSWAEADADQAEFLLADRDRSEAEDLIHKALQENPQSGRANALMSLLLGEKGRYGEATPWATKAIQLDPNDYHGYFYRAMGMNTGHMNAATSAQVERDLEKTLELRPGLVYAEVLLSGLYMEQKDKVDQALTLASDAALNDPENDGVLTNLEMILLKQGRQADAVRVELQMLRRAHTPKEKAMVRNNIGWTLLRQNVAISRADHEIRVAAELDPNDAAILDSLGYLLMKEGDLPHAEEAFQHALQVRPKLVSSLKGLGDVLRRRHDLDGAIAEYRQALAVSPNDADAHYDLSVALKEKGDNADAAAELKAAQKLEPTNSTYR